MPLPISKIAACHIAPVWLDKTATMDKSVKWIEAASSNGAQLIVFPEAFLPAFPVWSACKAPIDNHHLFQTLCENSIYVDGPEIERLQKVCRDLKVIVCFGFNELSRVSVGCLWNSYVLIGDDGAILAHHRKLVPTFYEKLSWANGDGSGITAVDTEIGKIGALICGENTNSLARTTLITEGENIHISMWPSVWPTRRPGVGVNFDNVAANRMRISAHCFEGKCFGILCSAFFDRAAKDYMIADDPANQDVYEKSPQGATMFLDPTGAQIGDMLKDEEGIAYATFDLNKCIEPKQFHDLSGGYQRYDVFRLTVDKSRHAPLHYRQSALDSSD